VLDNFVATEDITSGINEGLSVLLGDKLAKFIRVLLEELLVLQHISNTLGDWSLRPSLECIFSVLHSAVELVLGGHGNLSGDILGKRALDVEALSGLDSTQLPLM